MKDSIAGTYWLVANGDGSRAICKGKKPKRIEKFGWVIDSPEMEWITLDNDIHVRAKYRDKIIDKSDFQGLVFPKISYEESPMEIEIEKSGKVYTYESKQTRKDV